jgi:hypothetical protein
MAIKYSFVDSVKYGTDDINAITKDLTGAGIAPFPTQNEYNTSDLNAMAQALVASGTSLDGCKCTVNNAATQNMSVSVAPGIIFFDSGVRLTVDDDGYTLGVEPNTAGFVFAHYSATNQTADILFSTDIPSDGEHVLLAEIAMDGTLTDRRSFARSKVATFGSNATYSTVVEPLETPIFVSKEGSYYTLITRRLSNVNLSLFNYAIITSASTLTKNIGLFDIKKNSFIIVGDDNGNSDDVWFDSNVIMYGSGARYEVYITENNIDLYQTSGYMVDNAGGETLYITLI